MKRTAAAAVFCSLLLFFASALFACGSGGGRGGLNIKTLGDRIPVNVHQTVVFDGKSYTITGKVISTQKVVPDNLAFAGAIVQSNGNNSVPVEASNGRVFAIKGVSKEQAIAVRFESANGVYFYYLEYRAHS